MNKTIYLVYRCDEWLSSASKELTYVGSDLGDCIAQIVGHKDCTKEQAEQLSLIMQSQSNNLGYEWIIDEVSLNCFCD